MLFESLTLYIGGRNLLSSQGKFNLQADLRTNAVIYQVPTEIIEA